MNLISGGGSFLGLNTAKALVKKGEGVVITTRRRNDELSARVAAELGGLAKVEVLDLTNMYEITNLFSRYDFKRVVHTATAHMYANTRAANFPSYQMLFNILEAATAFGVNRFILCNSMVVYRGVKGPFREDQPLAPDFSTIRTGTGFDIIPPFEVTLKRVMEAVALDYGVPMTVWDRAPELGSKPATAQMETVVLRFPAQVGPLYTSMYNPIACLAHAFVKKQPELLKDRPLRPFVDISYVLDNADAVATVATAKTLGYRIYNVSSNIHVTARETLEALYRVAPESESELKLNVAEQAIARREEYLDITRIRSDLGWVPKFTIDTMFADYVAWLRSNSH
jgi:nucleoside-diphosphate-sugar epimerase